MFFFNNEQFNFIVIFPFFIKYYHIIFIIIIFLHKSGVGYSGNSSTALERSDPGRTVGPSYSLGWLDFFFLLGPLHSFPILTPLLSSSSVFILFYSCCSHVRVFGKTLVNEFLISYSHTEWYLLFTDRALHEHKREFGTRWRHQPKHSNPV